MPCSQNGFVGLMHFAGAAEEQARWFSYVGHAADSARGQGKERLLYDEDASLQHQGREAND